jgi:hypothetical protein
MSEQNLRFGMGPERRLGKRPVFKPISTPSEKISAVVADGTAFALGV